jgi:hypothetical protein
MDIPVFNNFRLVLPQNILPHWLLDIYNDILKDAGLSKVYDGNPVNCITESIIGFNSPGKHLVIAEQMSQDTSKTNFAKKYYPKGLNAMRAISDDEFSLDFRHIRGFHNFHMLELAIMYMADDSAQKAQNETYKQLDSFLFIEPLTTNWKIVNTYSNIVYKDIDGNSFRYADGPNEKTFTVRFKFGRIKTEMYFKDKLISQLSYNNAAGN